MKTVKLSKASASQQMSQTLTAALQFLLIVPADWAANFCLIVTVNHHPKLYYIFNYHLRLLAVKKVNLRRLPPALSASPTTDTGSSRKLNCGSPKPHFMCAPRLAYLSYINSHGAKISLELLVPSVLTSHQPSGQSCAIHEYFSLLGISTSKT